MKDRIEKRPNIRVQLTATDKAIEMLGWLLVGTIWLLTLLSYDKLPNTIPIHFDSLGNVDGFGEKATILTLPRVATAIFIGMTILNQFPQVFNYTTNITNENALRQYTNATRMIRYLKLIVVIIFGILVVFTVKSAHGNTADLGKWFLPLLLVPIFVLITYFTILSSKSKT